MCLITLAIVVGLPLSQWLLIGACGTNNARLAEGLLSLKVDPNTSLADSGYALRQAALNGRMPIARLLLAFNADANLADQSGETPLQYAVMKGHADVVALLLSHGADPSVGAIELSTYKLAKGNPAMLRLLRANKKQR